MKHTVKAYTSEYTYSGPDGKEHTVTDVILVEGTPQSLTEEFRIVVLRVHDDGSFSLSEHGAGSFDKPYNSRSNSRYFQGCKRVNGWPEAEIRLVAQAYSVIPSAPSIGSGGRSLITTPVYGKLP